LISLFIFDLVYKALNKISPARLHIGHVNCVQIQFFSKENVFKISNVAILLEIKTHRWLLSTHATVTWVYFPQKGSDPYSHIPESPNAI